MPVPAHEGDRPAERFDVVVAGAGMAGLAAAAAAADAGASVVVIEKAAAPGGTAKLSGGLFWTDASFEDHRRRNPRGDPELGRVLVERYEDTAAWLAEGGAQLGPRMTGLFETGVGRRLLPDMPGFVAGRVDRLERAGVHLRCRTSLARLHLDDRARVRGVRVRDADGLADVAADTVVLATGGFAADPEMLARYVSRYADRMHLRNHGLNTGDGLRAAADAGAAMSRGMHAFYGHLMPAPPARVTPERFVELTQYYSVHAVLVNQRGERFCDETLGDEFNAQALATQGEALGFLLVDDSLAVAVTDPPVPSFPSVDRLGAIAEVGGRVLRADSLEDLAASIDEAGGGGWRSVQTLREYNELVLAHPERLPVPRRARRHAIETPPFVAVPVTPGITMTEGGLKIDAQARVVDRRGEPIPGLFAAGGDGGGVYHEAYAGGLAMSTVFGRIAGTQAAALSAKG